MQGQTARHKRKVSDATARGGVRALLALALLGSALGACSGGGSINIANSQTGDPATIDYPIFYVKRSTPLETNGTLVQDDLRILNDAVPGADLYMRAAASPSAAETNITSRITAGAMYDVKDVDVSADGSVVVFAMRGPLTTNMQQDKAPSWRIWQYVIATASLSLVVNPTTDPDPATVNDVGPQFLPDGRVVFTTTRQRQAQGILLDEGMPQFIAEDEERTEPAFVVAQLVLLAVFVVLGYSALKRFHPQAA